MMAVLLASEGPARGLGQAPQDALEVVDAPTDHGFFIHQLGTHLRPLGALACENPDYTRSFHAGCW